MTTSSSISYQRLNHHDFDFNIRIGNPEQSRKKVIVRIFLGISDSGSFNPLHMIEMDRFVHTLSGNTKEIIKRRSKESSNTMKEGGMTINRKVDMIEAFQTGNSNNDIETYCGFPHNVYLPRSTPEGTDFELVAFVNDVDQEVMEGSDGIEHMMCGHKYDSVVLDDRMFGFPFDRDIDFDLNLVKSRVFAQTTIRITLGSSETTTEKEETSTTDQTTNKTSEDPTDSTLETTTATTKKDTVKTTKTSSEKTTPKIYEKKSGKTTKKPWYKHKYDIDDYDDSELEELVKRYGRHRLTG